MAKEYIEREAANDWLVNMFYSEEDEGCKELVERFNKAIPAADVAPVVRWVKHEMDGLASNIPAEYDGKWIIVTDGKNISVERFKYDAYDHFYPSGRWFELEDVKYWMPLPEPPKEEK